MEPALELARTAAAVGGLVPHAILLDLKRHGPATTGRLTAATLPYGSGRQTAIEKTVKRLVRDGFVEVSATGPPTRYGIADPGDRHIEAMTLGGNGRAGGLVGARLLLIGIDPVARRQAIDVLQRPETPGTLFEAEGGYDLVAMPTGDISSVRDLEAVLRGQLQAVTSVVRLSAVTKYE
jgi:hypothetical protein